jgi:hypothetical protein
MTLGMKMMQFESINVPYLILLPATVTGKSRI